MSYDIYLCDPVTEEVINSDQLHFMTGGTYQVGGTTKLWLNITYNYCGILVKYLGPEGIRTNYGKSAIQSIPILESAISKLENNTDSDYWKATEGNVKKALCQLLAMAYMRPDGVWKGD